MKNKVKIRTIGDLPLNQDLAGIKFKHPETGETCIYVSQWSKGIWYKREETDGQVFPLLIDYLSEVLEFELVL